ncbi:MAG: helix-hairpin-helix domain-containing protein [Chloracidobacterium sp.]|nr:helix-hairpin-helix domain-containing protein [Chloracidobacterium sp.]
MYRIILILILFSLMAGCTSRVVYDEQIIVATTPSSLNINTATAKELEALPYIGRKTAEKIIEFREDNGPFRRVEHLMQIRGISEKRFLEIQQFLKAE